jgi:toxin ParE1/3/4
VNPTIRLAAKDDILRQYRYYLADRDNPAVADRFLKAVRKTIQEIARCPLGGAPKHLTRDVLHGLRSWPVKDFEDIRIYYLPAEDAIGIIRLLHGRRDINRILQKESDKEEQ